LHCIAQRYSFIHRFYWECWCWLVLVGILINERFYAENLPKYNLKPLISNFPVFLELIFWKIPWFLGAQAIHLGAQTVHLGAQTIQLGAQLIHLGAQTIPLLYRCRARTSVGRCRVVPGPLSGKVPSGNLALTLFKSLWRF
jgi:hypothetical protein